MHTYTITPLIDPYRPTGASFRPDGTRFGISDVDEYERFPKTKSIAGVIFLIFVGAFVLIGGLAIAD